MRAEGFFPGFAENFCSFFKWLNLLLGILNRTKSKNIYTETFDTKRMRSPSEIKRVVESRLRSYLSRDRTGIRREVLRLFVKTKSITIAQLVAELQKRFTVTFHAIASMVGIIASRIGILRATRNADGVNMYELKEKYVDIVIGIVGVA
jgi:ethanolamine utilization microcompartment shell protein EutS